MYWKLVGLRAKHNMTQKDMAHLLKISLRSYGLKERQEREFKVDECYIIARHFKLPIEDIFFDPVFGGSEQNEDVDVN